MRDHVYYRDEGRIWCQVCGWSWSQRPTTRCPGVPRYGGDKPIPANLFSRTALARMGLSAVGAPSGCWYRRSTGNYIMLYDIERSFTCLLPSVADAMRAQMAGESKGLTLGLE